MLESLEQVVFPEKGEERVPMLVRNELNASIVWFPGERTGRCKVKSKSPPPDVVTHVCKRKGSVVQILEALQEDFSFREVRARSNVRENGHYCIVFGGGNWYLRSGIWEVDLGDWSLWNLQSDIRGMQSVV